ELATIAADVGVVDIAIDDKTYRVAIDGFADFVGGLAHGRKLRAMSTEQSHDLGFAQGFAALRALQNRAQFALDLGRAELHLAAGPLHNVLGQRLLAARGPGIDE